MTAPYRRTLATRERGFPWQEHFEDVIPGYNAYSPPGDVTGEVVYANYGLPEDYAALDELGVSVAGKIVLVRYGGSFRGVKAQQAELRGAKGLIIYSDPADDGFKRGPVYPDGPWRPADGIQRGSIQYIFNYPGDPLTPGVPSVPGTRRLPRDQAGNLPKIPTTPISYGEAQPLLESLTGPEAPEDFKGGLPITYRVGPGGTRVRLDLDIAYEQTPVSNVIATIRGTTKPDEKVVIGAHYDGWTYGTSDNTSGWTAIMQVGRSLGRLLDRGWRPERTIVLAGWDGEEYGLLGSTEWVGAVPGGPAPQRRRLRQPRRRRRDRVQRRRRAAARRRARRGHAVGARPAHGAAGLRHVDGRRRRGGGDRPARQRLGLHRVPGPPGRAVARGRLHERGQLGHVPLGLRRPLNDGALPRSRATSGTRAPRS